MAVAFSPFPRMSHNYIVSFRETSLWTFVRSQSPSAVLTPAPSRDLIIEHINSPRRPSALLLPPYCTDWVPIQLAKKPLGKSLEKPLEMQIGFCDMSKLPIFWCFPSIGNLKWFFKWVFKRFFKRFFSLLNWHPALTRGSIQLT